MDASKAKGTNDTLNISKKSPTPTSQNAIGQKKMQPSAKRNVTTSVNLKGRSSDWFKNRDSKARNDVDTTGGI